MTRIIYGDIVFKEGEAHVVRIVAAEDLPTPYTDALDMHADEQAQRLNVDWLMPDVYEGRITYAEHVDQHQAAEAAAFSLLPQAGAAAVDTTGDMFGFNADDMARHQAARCSTNLRPAATHTVDLFGGEL